VPPTSFPISCMYPIISSECFRLLYGMYGMYYYFHTGLREKCGFQLITPCCKYKAVRKPKIIAILMLICYHMIGTNGSLVDMNWTWGCRTANGSRPTRERSASTSTIIAVASYLHIIPATKNKFLRRTFVSARPSLLTPLAPWSSCVVEIALFYDLQASRIDE